jgi:hypothetical protein
VALLLACLRFARFAVGSYCCGWCPCCAGKKTPNEIQATIAGLANDNCTDCGSGNGTFILKQHTVANGFEWNDHCRWVYEPSGGGFCDGVYRLWIVVSCYPGIPAITVGWDDQSGTRWWWRKSLQHTENGIRVDCNMFYDQDNAPVEITIGDATGNNDGYWCDDSGSSCVIEAVS